MESLHASLQPLDDLSASRHCLKLLTSGAERDESECKEILRLGQARLEGRIERIKRDVEVVCQTKGESSTAGLVQSWDSQSARDALEEVLAKDAEDAEIAMCHVALEDIGRRLETFEVLQPRLVEPIKAIEPRSDPVPESGETVDPDGDEKADEMEIDDPWAEASTGANDTAAGHTEPQAAEDVPEDPWETNSTGSSRSSAKGKTPSIPRSRSPSIASSQDEVPFNLPAFLSQQLAQSALDLAANGSLTSLQILLNRHGEEIWPWRFALLDALPPWINPLDLPDPGLLPRIDSDGSESPRPKLPSETFSDLLLSWYRSQSVSGHPHHHLPASRDERLSTEEMSQWYMGKVDDIDDSGLIDIQLAWVQHGASRGLPNLDALGEELSLLSRLAYDADLDPASDVRWNLASWRETSEEDIVRAYLSGSDPNSVLRHIRRLVLPYLYVLESRAEREGKADPGLVDRYFHDALLNLPLELALPIFEASKATLSTNDRLIKNDLTVARLALACLYGSSQRDVWGKMSAIFECLPVWDVSSQRNSDDDKELTSTTLDSIATFVRPRKAGDAPPTARDLFFFFSPLPFASLSRALDILDVHLESGEILSRWDTPVQLRFLLQSAGHHQDQLELAEKMVRRQSARGVNTEAKWASLWTDILKLSGGEDTSLRGAFGMLTVQELMRLYLAGILASGSACNRALDVT